VGRRAADSARWFRAALWVLQGLLAVVFAVVGWAKVAKSGAALQSRLDWTSDVPLPLLRCIGVCEVLGAVGVLLPAATRIHPELTPVAGTCLTTVMALAFAFHVYRGDPAHLLIVPAALGLASAIVTWARLRKAPVDPR
jgi:uncharacterized membrane protein YphA (DoxX/SURF4 family)